MDDKEFNDNGSEYTTGKKQDESDLDDFEANTNRAYEGACVLAPTPPPTPQGRGWGGRRQKI